jgi:hypothetical protein
MDSQNGEELITTNLRKPDIVDFHNKISEWLTDPSESFYKNNNDVRLSQFTIYLSPKTKPTPSVSGNIVIVQQYYVPNNKKRHEEIKLALMCNCNNDAIDRIVLLNERIYSDDELGITNDKIEQIDISHRITYRDVFEFSNKLSDIVEYSTEHLIKRSFILKLLFSSNDFAGLSKYIIFIILK